MATVSIKSFERIIVWIRNDLRVQDHLALWSAQNDAKEVIPIFIIDNVFENSAPAKKKIIIEGLLDVQEQLRRFGGAVVIRKGTPEEILPAFLNEVNASGVYVTWNDNPFEKIMMRYLQSQIESYGKIWREFKDHVVFEGTEILTSSGKPYLVYSPYKNAWRAKIQEIPPVLPFIKHMAIPDIPSEPIPPVKEHNLFPVGGETFAKKSLNEFLSRRLAGYHGKRDIPAEHGTSRLSHLLASGALSVRTLVNNVLGVGTEAKEFTNQSKVSYLNEIIWREFYYQVMTNFPHVVGGAFKKEFDDLPWIGNSEWFEAWCCGMTGYPIVDAAMRQLILEGWMHNRSRMIVASFLTKDLHIDWRKGESHFMKHLADGDIALNNGGWQWSAGTGTDAQPWFRIFNPVLQGKKFDVTGKYVKKYIPELINVPEKYIHEPWLMPASVQFSIGCIIGKDYPKPIIDHSIERLKTLKLFGVTKNKNHESFFSLASQSV